MKKQAIVQKILEALGRELDGYARSARAAQAEATDEQSKAENKYDTRGLEASYLARGQSRQAAEVGEAVQLFRELVLRDFSADQPTDLSALVELEGAGETSLYFIGPCAGGTEVVVGRRAVVVLSPQSPLGRELMGRKAGSSVAAPGGRTKLRIVKVS